MLPLQVYRQALPSGGQTLPISCITHCSSNIKVCTCRWSVFGLSISLSIHSFLFVNNSYIYLHSHGIRLQRSIRKLWQIFSNERHWSSDGKIDIDCFDFLGEFRRLSINIIRIEIHFFRLHWEMKGHRSRVNLWEVLCASQDLHVTSVLSFPNTYEKSVLQSLNKVKNIKFRWSHGY